jgi:hypothetical protein
VPRRGRTCASGDDGIIKTQKIFSARQAGTREDKEEGIRPILARNGDISRAFDEVADIYEMRSDNPFQFAPIAMRPASCTDSRRKLARCCGMARIAATCSA